ncbi:MAG: FUSC family protein, partial [Xanthomonadales bacterium]|nr:FUSC family protein [Xanthomonadales bacterium]
HGNEHARGRAPEAFLVLAAELERMRFELVALEDLQLDLQATDAQCVSALTAAAAAAMEQVASALQRAQPVAAGTEQLGAYDQILSQLQQRAEQADRASKPLTMVTARGLALGAQLRAAMRNADFAGSRGEIRATYAERSMPRVLRQRQAWEVVRANLNLHSISLRHALRSSACITLALALSLLSGSSHAYWMPMTVAIVLKPDFGATVNYGLLRVIGTLAGLLLTTVLLHSLLDSTTSRIVLLAICCFVYRQVAPMHYGLGVTTLTGMVVILLAFAGEPAAQVMWARGEFTMAGCGLALLVYALWPTWERSRVRESLATLFDCYQRYLHSLMANEPGERANARAAARAARSNAIASLERLQREPAPAQRLLASAQALLANSSRLARIAMTIEAILESSEEAPCPDPLCACLTEASALVAAMASSIRDASDAPDAAKLHQSARALHDALQAVSTNDPQYHTAIALTHVTDRLDDTLGTLAFILATSSARE